MSSRLLSLLLTLALLLCAAPRFAAQQPAAAEKATLQIQADELSYGVDSAVAQASGNVVVDYGKIRMTCQQASVNQQTKDFSASGDVVISMEGQGSWQAPSLHGNLDDATVAFGPFRMDTEVWHLGGDSGESLGADDGQIIKNGWMSTCDCEHPHYRIQAAEIRYNRTDNTVVAKHATLRVGDLPIFYLPWLFGTADDMAGMVFRPGYSGKRGAYLRLGRLWKHTDKGSSQVYVDGMTKRGVGVGQETDYRSDNRDVQTTLYALHDQDPAETRPGYDRRFRSQDDRFRLKLYLREELAENWSLCLNVDYLSDISMLDDWFRHDWRHWGQPRSFATLSYDNGWLHSAITVRPRLNQFYTVGEQLPEWSLDIPRNTLLDLGVPLVYSSHSSAGFYTMKWRDSDVDRKALIPASEYDPRRHGDPEDYRSFRADTLHTLQAPLEFFDAITLTPRASVRATAYSRTSKRRVTQKQLAEWIEADNPDDPSNSWPVDGGYDDRGGSKVRIATELGLEGRSAFTSDWMDAKCDWLEMDGLRHVVEPYFNYTYSGAPSVDREKLYFFDEVDRLQRQNFLRLGLEQRWLTRDDGGHSRTLLSLENYLDIHHRVGDETGRHWGDFGTRLVLQPRSDLRLWGVLLHDVGAGEIQRGEVGVRFGEEETGSFSLKYTYRNDHLSRSVHSMGSSLADFTGESSYLKRYFQTADTISAQVNIPLNSITSLEIGAEYDFEKNNLEEHHYYITRQLHCWTLVGGVGWDDHEFEAVILLRLVAFPNVKLNLNL